MGIVFEDASKPTIQRQNEFRDVVAYLADNRSAVKSYVVSEKTLAESQEKAAADKRKMAEAGNELPSKVTIRTREENLDDGKSIKVFLWATGKIQRKPKVTASETAPVVPEKGATKSAK